MKIGLPARWCWRRAGGHDSAGRTVLVETPVATPALPWPWSPPLGLSAHPHHAGQVSTDGVRCCAPMEPSCSSPMVPRAGWSHCPAKELVEEIPEAYLLQQFDNPANPAVHECTMRKRSERLRRPAGCPGGGRRHRRHHHRLRAVAGAQTGLQVVAVSLQVVLCCLAIRRGTSHSGVGAGFVPAVLERL